MKDATADLIALLASGRMFFMEDRVTFTLIDASQLVFTTNRDNLLPTDPLLKRGPVDTVIGMQVGTMTIDLVGDAETLIGSTPLNVFALGGGFDGASVLAEQVYRPSPTGNIAGTLHLHQGRVGPVDVDSYSVRMSVPSDLELLNVMLPRNVFQVGCVHNLYDTRCGLVAANFTTSGTVGSSSTEVAITSNLGANAAYYDLGIILFTSGALSGLARSVRSYAAGGNMQIMPPLPSAPAPGVTFTIRPGCDKLPTTCEDKFGNLDRYRGYEFIPVPEASF